MCVCVCLGQEGVGVRDKLRSVQFLCPSQLSAPFVTACVVSPVLFGIHRQGVLSSSSSLRFSGMKLAVCAPSGRSWMFVDTSSYCLPCQ